MTVTLAFYKGRGGSRWSRLQDTAIRWRTRPCKWSFDMATYSHVELISGTAQLDTVAPCLSSSGRDGGVREKEIFLKHDHWDLVELAVDPSKICEFIESKIGAKYDYLAILFSHALAMGLHNRQKWICSEIIAAALGLPKPHKISPQELFHVLTLLVALSDARGFIEALSTAARCLGGHAHCIKKIEAHNDDYTI